MLQEELINSFLEFLELAIHISLWSRKLYAADLFERVKYCGFNARKSRHPGLNSYISSTVGNLKGLIKSGTLKEVAVVFFDLKGCPVDRITFALQVEQLSPQASLSSLDISALESGFTSALLVLSCADRLHRPLPTGSTFEVVAYSISRSGVDVNYFSEDALQRLELRQPLKAHALKSVNVEGFLHLQVLLEQTAGT
ncbi:hypothetical protein CEUSTIGMA_g6424.t1 [Chlamydomonas eustigma]|uniref:HORMA domain-containing protein n=1 Tax=Chlamydomonas eustigma TaxID=1157962 RepID=A0A250X7C3_9CHLO|nr:hypothetical protein CEUSTIGMA_g6424.t1 [Chlamydomonas eustigma]|eukprot:GAX78984.1 hypothetical protein CEUSTIGMA_g6424.t1 [Chlamydomonas eustigma]